MPRYAVPLNNISFNSDLNPAFNTYNLRVMGERIFPRETAGGTSVLELTPTAYLYKPPILNMYDVDTNSTTQDGGTVEYTSPFSLGPSSGQVNPSVNYIINDISYSSVTIRYNADYGYTFVRWRNGTNGTIVSSNNPATINLSNSAFYNALTVRAEIVSF